MLISDQFFENDPESSGWEVKNEEVHNQMRRKIFDLCGQNFKKFFGLKGILNKRKF